MTEIKMALEATECERRPKEHQRNTEGGPKEDQRMIFSPAERQMTEIRMLCGALEVVDGEGELETTDVVEDDGGALLAIDHLDSALEALQGIGL